MYHVVFIETLTVYVNEDTTDKHFNKAIKNMHFTWWQIRVWLSDQPLSSLLLQWFDFANVLYMVSSITK